METMPYLDRAPRADAALPGGMPAGLRDTTSITTDWQAALPVLGGATVTLRELRQSDAASLLALLTTEEVSRFISPPPTTLAGFERFIAWTHAQRQAGEYACFAVVPHGTDTAIGIFQLRSLEAGFGIAEWGFAIGSDYWGTGVYQDGATALLAFAFEDVGVRRLEARACVQNGRGTGALCKVGAVAERVLRQAFLKDGQRHDQILWALHASDWQRGPTAQAQAAPPAPHRVH